MRTMTRWFMIGFVVLAVALGLAYQNILTLGLSLASLNLALFPAVFGSFHWQLKEPAVFWSLALAFLSVIIVTVTGQLTPETATISLPVALLTLVVFQKLFKK